MPPADQDADAAPSVPSLPRRGQSLRRIRVPRHMMFQTKSQWVRERSDALFVRMHDSLVIIICVGSFSWPVYIPSLVCHLFVGPVA